MFGAMVCVTATLWVTAGEPDILDSVKVRLLVAGLPAPGFCEVMALPVDGAVIE
jgi:hypothetical protein